MKINVRLIGIQHYYTALLRTEADLKEQYDVNEITDKFLIENDIEIVDSNDKEYLASFEYTGKSTKLYKDRGYTSTTFVLYNNETLTLTELFVDNTYDDENLEYAAERSLEYLSDELAQKIDINFKEFNSTIVTLDPYGLKLELEIDDISKVGIFTAPYAHVEKELPNEEISTTSICDILKDDAGANDADYMLYDKKAQNMDCLEEAHLKNKELTIQQLVELFNITIGYAEGTLPYEPYAEEEEE